MYSYFRIAGIVLAVVGLGLLILGLVWFGDSIPENDKGALWVAVGGLVVFVVGLLMFAGLMPEEVALPWGTIVFRAMPGPVRIPKVLSPKVRQERDRLIETLPGAKPGQFSIVEKMEVTCLNPSTLEFTPVYTLDGQFRIVDWNQALSVAFDYSMEGFRGQTVGEWIFFFENFEEVAKRGIENFKDKTPEEYPLADFEDLVFQSDRYGRFVATKRAYKIHSDNQDYQGWLIVLDLRFDDEEQDAQYKLDLMASIRDELMWSEYALSYDVLMNTKVYPELLDTILGRTGPFPEISADAFVLDLGAGTGNISEKLADSRRRVFAVESNPTMLDLLKHKCRRQLRYDDEQPGVIPIRQDINSLYGLPKDYFHYAILNNVLYTLANPLPGLRNTCELLRKGGEIRLSGPHKTTKLDRLLRRIKAELKAGPGFAGDVKKQYEKVEYINKVFLEPRLCRWSVNEVEEMLRAAGFSNVINSIGDAYAGQAMIVRAIK